MKTCTAMFASILLVACATVPQVSKETASADAFAHHQSYAWHSRPTIHGPLDLERIVSDIDRQLRSRGWAESGDSDVTVDADVVTRQTERSTSFHSQGTTRGWGLRAGLDPRGSGKVEMTAPAVKSTHVDKTSTLTIRMFDAESQKEIWEGAVMIVVSNSQERNAKALDDGIAKLFAGFPQAGAH